MLEETTIEAKLTIVFFSHKQFNSTVPRVLAHLYASKSKPNEAIKLRLKLSDFLFFTVQRNGIVSE